MGYRMQPIPAGTTLQDLTKHSGSRAHRQISKLFLVGGQYTCNDLAALTGLSSGSTWASVNTMKTAGLIYISNWQRPKNGGTTLSAMYSAGNKKDAPRPPPLPQSQRRMSYAKKQVVVEEPTIDPTHWQELAKALVPRRNEQEQHEVNRLYLNWISEGTYG